MKLVAEGEEGDERKIFREYHTQHGKINSLGIRKLIESVGMDLELQWPAGGIGYQGILDCRNSPPKKDSSDKTKVERFFHPVVETKNTDKVV